MELLHLSSTQLNNIREKGYTLDDFFYTWYSSKGDERFICFPINMKLVSMGKITAAGYDLISIINDKDLENKLSLEEKKQFEYLWEMYPSDDGTERFPATRLTRGNKDLAKKQFRSALKEHTVEEIIDCTKIYLDKQKSSSIESNNLKFLPHLHRFLAERKFTEVTLGELTKKLIDPNAPELL